MAFSRSDGRGGTHAPLETLRRGAQRQLGIDPRQARHVDDGEQQVAELVTQPRVVAVGGGWSRR